ncbi:hypothetical protein NA56DRAFT_453729 [Hyaloscypha hepaticicola]|uniref:DUF6594 domain-containing protein n=1 Tax=Hyaloscypha hepaticicola TaxID=2082293 RepID=A0A2J6PFL9_9HELO|nr:hypothetical protein NA56DRAFT_453729 [Hyaloscypha hepaticicola]
MPAMNISIQRRESSVTTMVSSQASSPRPPTPNETEADPAEDVNKPVEGWPALAKLMNDTPDLEAFPSFTDLNLKSLLYYQAELIYLRKELHTVEWKDFRNSTGTDDSSKFSKDLVWVFMAVEDGNPPEQWALICRIRDVLEKYNKALLQFSRISSLNDADGCNVQTLKDCIRYNKGWKLTGPGSETWGDAAEVTKGKSLPHLVLCFFTGFFKSPELKRKTSEQEFEEHLISPRAGRKPDGLTLWVAHSFIPLYHYFYKKYEPRRDNFLKWYEPHQEKFIKWWRPAQTRDAEKGGSKPPPGGDCKNGGGTSVTMTAYSENWIVRTTSIFTTVVACLLPTVAITVLARVHTMGMILGLIALFTAIFAVGTGS